MAILRQVRRNRYTVIDNSALEDGRLSFRARGLHAYMLSRPDHWEFSAERLAAETPTDGGGEGRDAVRTALRQLEAAGYLVRQKRQDPETGKWSTIVEVHEASLRPLSVAPTTDFQPSDSRTSVGPSSKQGTDSNYRSNGGARESGPHYEPPTLDHARELARTFSSIETVVEDELRAELRSKGCTDDVIELACETFRHRREGIPA